MPAFSEEESTSSAESDEVTDDVDDVSQFNVDVSSLCKPGSVLFPPENHPPKIRESVETRCNTALKHIDHGLQFLTSLEERAKAREAALEKEREKHERDNINMSVPNQPIPMGYSSTSSSTHMVLRRPRSVSEGGVVLQTKRDMTWTEYLKYLLLKKAMLVLVTMGEMFFNKKHLGRTLKCVKRAMNCHSMITSLTGQDETVTTECAPLLSFALGVAGDSYMGCVYNWEHVPVYHEQYNTALTAEAGITREIEKYTTELDRDWIIKQPSDIRESMELAIRCYTRALEMVDNKNESLIRRLANVENELGVFFMNQGTALLETVTVDTDDDDVSTGVSQTAMAGSKDLFNSSRKYLQQSVAKFESISDLSNIALLLSNTGRLSRLHGHMVSVWGGVERVEVSEEEAGHYRSAVKCYQQALSVLGHKRVNPGNTCF